MLIIKKQVENGFLLELINRKKNMPKIFDETTESIRQSIISSKGEKHCIRDYTGEIFELTEDMLVQDRLFDAEKAKDLSGIAECILQKYANLLSVAK